MATASEAKAVDSPLPKKGRRKPERSRTGTSAMKAMLEANTAGGARRVSEVFRDFCELSAIALRNSVDIRGREEREERYLQVVRGYTPEEANRFAELLAALTVELEKELSDVLGHLYMSLDLGNEDAGQFFTPYDVGLAVAQLTSAGLSAQLAGREYITVAEPACGSGGMIVAFAQTMREEGFNYQKQLHVTAQDIEPTAVHMTYIVLSLMHIPAVVVHGNTLLMEARDRWHTPAHILGGWSARLAARSEANAENAIGKTPALVIARPGPREPQEQGNTRFNGSADEPGNSLAS